MVEREGELLLGMKKRGFAAGRYNGFGGKVAEGETVEEAARRELKEEAGITATQMTLVGELAFSFASGSEPLLVYIYRVPAWRGEPVETEEMCPEWFNITQIPYERMWSDDIYWLPTLLAGQSFVGRFHFASPATSTDAATILSQELTLVPYVELAPSNP